MSTPTIEDRLRAIRQRIFTLMLRLPFIIAGAASPEAVELNDYLGYRGVNAPKLEAEVEVVDAATGEPVSPLPPKPWVSAPLAAADRDAAMGELLKDIYERGLVVRFETASGVVENVTPTYKGPACKIFEATVDSVVDAATPSSYPIDSPATVRGAGDYYYARFELDVDVYAEVMIISGVAGYRSNGDWVQWEGYAVYINVSGIKSMGGGIKIRSPVFNVERTEDGPVAMLITPFASVTITLASWKDCMGATQ